MVFSGGSMDPPLCTNGSAGYLMQLSVKLAILAREPKDFSRKILEAIHIRKEKPALNRAKGLDLDPVWDPVLIN